ncbi:unnamed protein product, partial [Rotaria sp. Silwood2]
MIIVENEVTPDILAWACDKIRSGGTYVQNFKRKILTRTFLRELKVLVHQLLGDDLTNDLITLVTYLAITQCKKVRVCDEDDDLSLYLLEALVKENQSQRLSSLKLHLSLAFDLNQRKFASQMLRTNQDMLEEDRLCDALVYRRAADSYAKKSSTEIVTVQKLRNHADEYENLAIRLLQCLYLSNSNMACLALKRENFEFNKFSSLKVA